MVTAAPKSILDEILDPLTECFTPEVAKRVLNISLHPDRQSRIDELATKANEGKLSSAERVEYVDYIEALNFLDILKAKGRMALPGSYGAKF